MSGLSHYSSGWFYHHDGAVSSAFTLDGFDVSTASHFHFEGLQNEFLRLIGALEKGLSFTFYSLRLPDNRAIDSYLDAELIRAVEVGSYFREKIAQNYSGLSFNNYFCLMVTSKSYDKGLSVGALERAWKKNNESLSAFVERSIPSAFTSVDVGFVLSFIYFSNHFSYVSQGFLDSNECDESIYLSEHGSFADPSLVDGCIVIGDDSYHKCCAIYQYPDEVSHEFFSNLTIQPYPCSLSISISYKSRQGVLRDAELKERKASDSGDASSQQVADSARQIQNHLLSQKDVTGFSTVIFHCVGTTAKQATEQMKAVSDELSEAGFGCDYSPVIQQKLFQSSMIGHGHCPPFSRIDTGHLMTVLMPFHQVPIVDSSGQGSLYLTSSGTVICLPYTDSHGVHHSLSAAKTGSGKSAEEAAKMLQCYSLGCNFLGFEIGQSFKWVVEYLGGSYISFDQDSAINPFPDFATANAIISQEKSNDLPLDLVSRTIASIAFLLIGRTELDIHEEFVCQLVLQIMYTNEEIKEAFQEKISPTLQDFFVIADALSKGEAPLDDLFDTLTESQKNALVEVVDNLRSFLGTSQGKMFSRDDTFVINPKLTVVDLRGLMAVQDDKLKLSILISLSMRFYQMALADKSEHTIISIDEAHEFSRFSGDSGVFEVLCAQLLKMGRKENAWLRLITQGLLDVSMDDTGRQQFGVFDLLYASGGHEDLRSFGKKMDDQKVARWESLINDPSYRQLFRIIEGGEYVLDLFYPQQLLAIAGTTPKVLKAKQQLSTDDDLDANLRILCDV